MNSNMNSRLRRPLTRLHRLTIIILAALAVFTLATAPVNAAPRQQTVVGICSRTAEVQTAILAQSGRGDVLNHHRARNSRVSPEPWLIKGYSSASIIPADFAGLTMLTVLQITYSPHADHRTRERLQQSYVPDYPLSRPQQHRLAPRRCLLQPTALQNLLVNYNAITSLPKGLFDGLPALTYIQLESNHIKVLEEGIFNETPALTVPLSATPTTSRSLRRAHLQRPRLTCRIFSLAAQQDFIPPRENLQRSHQPHPTYPSGQQDHIASRGHLRLSCQSRKACPQQKQYLIARR